MYNKLTLWYEKYSNEIFQLYCLISSVSILYAFEGLNKLSVQLSMKFLTILCIGIYLVQKNIDSFDGMRWNDLHLLTWKKRSATIWFAYSLLLLLIAVTITKDVVYIALASIVLLSEGFDLGIYWLVILIKTKPRT